jgi:ATP-dependent DNA ligase
LNICSYFFTRLEEACECPEHYKYSEKRDRCSSGNSRLFELKHDGFRALAYVADGRSDLISRKNNTYKSFGPLREALAGLRVQDAVLDGEIVCLDDEGRS